jgi:hypothetical protein
MRPEGGKDGYEASHELPSDSVLAPRMKASEMGRARRSFRIVFLIAVLALGGLSWLLTAPAGARTAVAFVVSALALVAAIALDIRILIVCERRRVY